jgi:hypothetical protein
LPWDTGEHYFHLDCTCRFILNVFFLFFVFFKMSFSGSNQFPYLSLISFTLSKWKPLLYLACLNNRRYPQLLSTWNRYLKWIYKSCLFTIIKISLLLASFVRFWVALWMGRMEASKVDSLPSKESRMVTLMKEHVLIWGGFSTLIL